MTKAQLKCDWVKIRVVSYANQAKVSIHTLFDSVQCLNCITTDKAKVSKQSSIEYPKPGALELKGSCSERSNTIGGKINELLMLLRWI